ncbi:MAG: hypothetical protein GTN60_04730 [Pseudomonas stutzeri]|nr:hypothetical protein [Stutzerimonas stutzeri]NIM53820.1 hypothetical protein [Stutzerimonas stutzeri]NIM86127.1 hypothetical protein [Stutzerimonas stutzeri]NIN80723.1 hypothetical protein [Stutzerimonas stutzeri]NIO99969.1 hypothetical protein [Stutzerimonas stutzeri]
MADDADDSRERAEKGRQRMAFNELVATIMYEINAAHGQGRCETTCKLSKSDLDFADALIETLQNKGYEATLNDQRLHLAWELSEEAVNEANARERFNDFYRSVTYSIRDASDSGENSTTISVADSDEEFVDRIIEILEERDYQVAYEPQKGRLAVEWPQE